MKEVNTNKELIIRNYISGFFDAEGMIRIEKSSTPTISIKQTYKPVLDWINRVNKDHRI